MFFFLIFLIYFNGWCDIEEFISIINLKLERAIIKELLEDEVIDYNKGEFLLEKLDEKILKYEVVHSSENMVVVDVLLWLIIYILLEIC